MLGRDWSSTPRAGGTGLNSALFTSDRTSRGTEFCKRDTSIDDIDTESLEEVTTEQ